MEKLIDVLKEIRPEFDFESSNNFIDDGMLDSFDIINLVSTLDEMHSISIDGSDIIPENFNNFEAIKKLLERYGVEFEF